MNIPESDPCLVCPNSRALRYTIKPRLKFCVYCYFRDFILRNIPAMDTSIDLAYKCEKCGKLRNPTLLLKNRLHVWKQDMLKCRKCRHYNFIALKETKVQTEAFGPTHARIAVVCANCNAHYILEDLLKGDNT